MARVHAGVQDAPIAPRPPVDPPAMPPAARIEPPQIQRRSSHFCSQHKNGSVRTAAVAAHHPLGQVLRACVDGCSLR